jgi:hypothetical protein
VRITSCAFIIALAEISTDLPLAELYDTVDLVPEPDEGGTL